VSFRIRLLLLFVASNLVISAASAQPIDRRNLVQRHNPTLGTADIWSPFSVGNGGFTFTADITGLQTFPERYETSIPLSTMSWWGWHSIPDSAGHPLSAAFTPVNTYGRMVDYASSPTSPAAQWLRANPHRLHLGQIGFEWRHRDGTFVQMEELRAIKQTLDLWSGVLHSTFRIGEQSFDVQTACAADKDAIAVRVQTEGPAEVDWHLLVHFPYGSVAPNGSGADWTKPQAHHTDVLAQNKKRLSLHRRLDETDYNVDLTWNHLSADFQQPAHLIRLTPQANSCECVIAFHPENERYHSSASRVFASGKRMWQDYWQNGGMIDFSGSKDPRANELERRIILSQYLMRCQNAAPLPPQETGLTVNSWYGKFHLEMHWWHSVHYPLWDRSELFAKSIPWYKTILPRATAEATHQGYDGCRWPKMVAFDGRESPSSVGVFLIWQQPHPLYYLELLYRQNPKQELVKVYLELVTRTADFMASYAVWDSLRRRYVLGPPLIPAQEKHAAAATFNPCFELAYWRYGLEIAQKWRERLGMPRNPQWEAVRTQLSDYPVKDGLYQNVENNMTTFTDPGQRRDHPSLVAAFGMLPGPGIDPEMMRATVKQVMQQWNWETCWGWDFPLVAMTAARVGEPELAIDALLMTATKNKYLNNGHNFQRDGLPLYLPGNGGLLTAVAMMAAGWDGAGNEPTPGFPKNGLWQIKWEGLQRMP
jgi:protein-glucosylgalactosylhydroxylysine glucosidase